MKYLKGIKLNLAINSGFHNMIKQIYIPLSYFTVGYFTGMTLP